MLSPGAAIGRYVIHRKLAEGGMAEVYLASAVGPEGFAKDVVIKVVRSFLASDQQFIDLFIAEARLSSRLNHANVVQIFDFGKADDSYYLAMEFVRGASLWDLRKRCRERGILFPPVLAAEIGTQLSRGLQYAHTLSDRGQPLGLVHRDVTPHNVLLSFDGAIKLTDFGIAKAGSTQTAPGILKGKFAYMSPEQARGDVVDARSDVFALGIVLWELLTGGRLFEADSEVGVLRAVQTASVVSPSRLNPEIPEALSDIVMKALARPLDERFQSALEVERALAMYVLSNAKSLDDTSSSLFMQTMFREEYESAHQAAPAVDELAHAATLSVNRDHGQPTSPQRFQHHDSTTPSGLGHEVNPTEQLPAIRAVSPSGRLQPGPPPARPRTDLQRVSRKLPTVEFEAAKPQKNWLPLALVAMVAVLLAAGGFVWNRSQQPLALSAPVAAMEEVVDAGLEVAAVVTPPTPTPTPEPDAGEAPVAVVPIDAPVVVAAAEPARVAKPVRVAAPPQIKPRAEVDATPGALEIRAVPYATVTIDGRDLGEVEGVKVIALPPGAHQVVLTHPKKTERKWMMVKPGQTASLVFEPLK